MKVVLRHEPEDESRTLILRITLTKKYINGTGGALLKMFANYYRKKFAAEIADAGESGDAGDSGDGGSGSSFEDDHYLRIAGSSSTELGSSEVVSDYVSEGDDIYIIRHGSDIPEGCLATKSSQMTGLTATLTDSHNARSSGSGVPSEAAGAAAKAKKEAAAGRVRCKRFGCNTYFCPTEFPTLEARLEKYPKECRHHVAPPIFHETAKWWSCCPNKKAYDWEEFQAIPGCQVSCHTTETNPKFSKAFLGGTDLREENAPKRIDGGGSEQDELADPRKKLELMRKACLACGVTESVYDRAWGKLAAKHGDLGVVAKTLGTTFEAALKQAAGLDDEPAARPQGLDAMD